jgi:hypothetical protein
MLEQLLDYHREFKPKTEMIVNIEKELLPHFSDDLSTEIFEINVRIGNIQQNFFATSILIEILI